MVGKVFIEEHLGQYLKSLESSKSRSYIPGVVLGQVIGDNYYVVHLSALSSWNEDSKNNEPDVLAYDSLADLLANTDIIFNKSLDVVNLLPGGSQVLGLFFVVPQDLKSIQPLNIDFNEYDRRLNAYFSCKKTEKTWNYLLLNYSAINKKSFCYTVDFNRLSGPVKTTYKSIDEYYGSFDDDWVTLVGTFNFGAIDQLNVVGGPKALASIRESLLDKFESVLNQSLCTFNGCVHEENETLKEFKCDTIGDTLKNVVKIELYREVDSGNECKNASLKVERGKGKILMSGLCSLVVPFNRNGTIKDAIKAIHEDAMQTFATRLKMHLESFVEEDSLEDEDGDANIMHETPRRILILKTEGSRFAFSDYVFPGEAPEEAFSIAGEILNLPNEKLELYDVLEKGRHPYYDTLPDIENSPPQDTGSVATNNNVLIYFTWVALILVILAFFVKQVFM